MKRTPPTEAVAAASAEQPLLPLGEPAASGDTGAARAVTARANARPGARQARGGAPARPAAKAGKQATQRADGEAPAEPGKAPGKTAAKAARKTAQASTPAQKLAKLGLARDLDFALHLPIRYEDETRLVAIGDLLPGLSQQTEGVVTDAEVGYRPRRQLVVHLRGDDGAMLSLRFVNFYGSQLKQFAVGQRMRVRGDVRGGFFGLEMVHPSYHAVAAGDALPTALTPVYSTTAGVSQTYLRRAIDAALSRVDLDDTVPPALWQPLAAALGLPPLPEAIRALHRPAADADQHGLIERTAPAWQRVKFDELLAQQLSMARARAERRSRRAPAMPLAGPAAAPTSLSARLHRALPFALTGAQQRVVAEIGADLAQTVPMQRLLQGDVGSGKTVVAALAAAQAIDAGHQVALMAPTELLAEQHARKLHDWLSPLGVRIAWLTGSLRAKAKREALAEVASGEAALVVGTHAIIQDTVEFARLGLVIVDEQHRFGVGQRLALRRKAAGATGDGDALQPHQLMMSATPIPRTLAMSYYADLDVSTIDELPPGRTPVLTKLVADARREEVIERVRGAALDGRQVYWVCPLIEESEALQLQTAVDTWQTLCAALPELSIGLVHGRLPAAEKQQTMQAFAGGATQVLVATTVIEVGVDVPNASLMVIEHAERFGLAQLHQLRGRVGRGSAASVCVLLYTSPLSQTARERLKVMHESNDGFEIARRDLDIRGPGEFLGARQSGVAMLRFADLNEDAGLVGPARQLAAELLAAHPEAASRHLDRWLGTREQYLMA
ncbi:ATP-dependent DNA helicase RecG [Chitinasiproducens palmae]|uniref:ATP-dependent DNA helicase RecG n=1 Tax=Chitinasiproducens palmae TaxID=1770053 RepID=A0A1H2PRH2_9BURK|nr:ATP-dependent DNA helicase RecG [Chitinasiproducens palmae]SDV49483.1 ATP-dependent DNA helicase RecG [Chitinasiproducens palmae]